MLTPLARLCASDPSGTLPSQPVQQAVLCLECSSPWCSLASPVVVHISAPLIRVTFPNYASLFTLHIFSLLGFFITFITTRQLYLLAYYPHVDPKLHEEEL